MKSTTTESFELASYRLRDVAVNWYESLELSRGEDAPPTVWQEFTKAFLRHYLPLELRRARVDRFLTLRQGNMSVWDYSLQFNSLARYAPAIVSKMEDQVHRFVMGLEPHLLNDCMLVSLQPDMDISRIQAYAQGVEENRGSIVSMIGPRIRERGSRQNSRASGSQYRGESNQMRPPLPRCTQCGKQHTGQCRMGLGVCYTCGYPSHVMRDFSMRGDASIAQPLGFAAGSSSSVRPSSQGPQAQVSRGRGIGGASSYSSSSSSPQNCIYALAGRQDQESSPNVVTGEPVLEWKGNMASLRGRFISYLKARKMIRKGSIYHLVRVQDVEVESPNIQSIPVVNEFPDELPGFLLEREIRFSIDLLLDTHPISLPPYRMTSIELKELKEQLKDLLEKGIGLGCVLMRHGKVGAYASRQLRKHEKNYSTHDFELAAVIHALKMWRHYLYGIYVDIYTDYKSLQYIFKQKEFNLPQRRWLELLKDYDVDILYHMGKANVVADALSCRSMGLHWQVMGETHYSRYSIHPGVTNMYHAIREIYWWDRMENDIAEFVAKCPNCQQVNIEHQKPGGLLQAMEILTGKWEIINTDFIVG
ncbi:uncharacterized protein [Nicotiana sylvestris]|uniref:uncharacterized protein n=1 Tax=Nicotiana sylvestris TaxID=4096 RepID=UPI00388CEB5D